MTARKPRLIYTAAAVGDLARLHAFISEHDPAAARRIGTQLVKRIDALRDSPLMGSAVAAAPDPQSVCDMVFGTYSVRYAVTLRTIAVLRVWHHFEQRDQGDA